MHIVVCIKQVPDSSQIRVHPVTNTIMRQGVPAIINPYDLYSLEEALRLKDKYHARVTLVCMGPPQAEASIRKALSYGADDAILISDRAFAGSDTLATSYAIATAIAQIQKDMPVDLIFCGKQTIDGDTAQVGPGVAKRLDFRLLTYVSAIKELDLDKQEIVVERRAEGGVQVMRTRTPVLITTLEGINEIRYATMENMFRAARYPLKIWDRQAAGIEDPAKIGLKGSPTVVSKVFAPQPKAQKAELIDSEGRKPSDLAATLVTKLFTHNPDLRTTIQR